MKTIPGVMISIACCGCSTLTASSPSHPADATRVEVSTGGDDGLTHRLADAVRDEFKQSPLFVLAPAPTPGSLRVTIPTHVGWEQVGSRTRVTYQLRLDRGDRNFGESNGVCWEDELRTCARQVLKKATSAIAR